MYKNYYNDQITHQFGCYYPGLPVGEGRQLPWGPGQFNT